MELRHLRVFRTLAEELHFGRTAARLHTAQSAISQTVKDLEAEVGAALFARTKRQVTLTAAGAALLTSARAALVEVERGCKNARRAADGQTGTLTLRYGMLASLTVLPRAVARFARAHPDVEVRVQPGGSADQLV